MYKYEYLQVCVQIQILYVYIPEGRGVGPLHNFEIPHKITYIYICISNQSISLLPFAILLTAQWKEFPVPTSAFSICIYIWPWKRQRGMRGNKSTFLFFIFFRARGFGIDYISALRSGRTGVWVQDPRFLA